MLEVLLGAASLLACEVAASPLIVAHRGGMDSAYPENTLPAFHHAAATGAHVIELDLRATRDGDVIVLHDPRVNRTTDGHGLVHQLSTAELNRLDTGNGVRIPSLREVLTDATMQHLELLFDLKPAPGLDLAAVVAQVHDLGRPRSVIFGVRSLEDRAALAGIDPDLRFLGFIPRPRQMQEFLDAGVEVIRLWPHWIERQPELVEAAHRAGARVWVTAGAAPVAELAALVAMGVDGLLTDRPAEAVSALSCSR